MASLILSVPMVGYADSETGRKSSVPDVGITGVWSVNGGSYHCSIGDESMVAIQIGVDGRKSVFAVVATPRLLEKLSHLSRDVRKISDVYSNERDAGRSWGLKDNNHGDGFSAPIVFSGQNPDDVGRR